MSDRLAMKSGWMMARALKLHEHFCAIAVALQSGCKVTAELKRTARMLDGMQIAIPGGEMILEASYATLRREWDYWHAGGRKGREEPAHVRKAEALLMAYKPGCGGFRAMPAALKQEIGRRITGPTGARDKHKRAPISAVYKKLCEDYQAQRPLPGIDYRGVPKGAEFPWSYDAVLDAKPPKTLRALGNLGAAAHKALSAGVSMNYAKLRKGELYTLDDVRLDIVCIDHATGKRTQAVCYILMEVGSRSIVAYVLRPAGAIRQEDVDELLAYGLQTPGFGIGVGYPTHILFERGSVACSESAQLVLEGLTEGGIRVHRTSMTTGVRWIGSARDKATGNAAGKAVIESFHRRLHYALLHLPGQRGNDWSNAPENLGWDGPEKTHRGSVIDEAEQLAAINHATGGKAQQKLPLLYLMELDAAVREAIKAHNVSAGHAYRGHGRFAQQEQAPGVWVEAEVTTGKRF